MKTKAFIEVNNDNGIFKVPADLAEGFRLIPEPEGKLCLTFWEKNRMVNFLKTFGFKPAIKIASE